jgi:hypothetical protein
VMRGPATTRFRSRATDFTGHTSSDVAGPRITATVVQQGSTSIRWNGPWTRRSSSSASGGSLRQSSAPGAIASFTFTGRSVAWVARTGAGFGKAQVVIDNGAPITVDLGSWSGYRKVVFAWTSASRGTHRIRVTNLATQGRPAITVDAFAVLK